MVSTINKLAAVRNIDLLNVIKNTSLENSELQTLDVLENKATDNVLKPLNIKHEKAVISLAQWLSKSKLVSNLSYSVNASRAFGKDEHDVVFNVVLAEKFEKHFVLLRGLFEFHNVSFVSIHADRVSRLFRVEIKIDDAAQVVDYFNLIFNSLIKEINFKRILKGIIKLEQRIKREQDLAYGSLKAAV